MICRAAAISLVSWCSSAAVSSGRVAARVEHLARRVHRLSCCLILRQPVEEFRRALESQSLGAADRGIEQRARRQHGS